MATKLAQLPDVEKLSLRVIRILGGNPGHFTLQGTNTYIIGTGSTRLLLDTGEGKSTWIKNLKDTLQEEHTTITQVIITHWHNDHVGGIKHLLELTPHAVVHKRHPDNMQHDIQDGQIFKTEGATLRAVFSPGHTKDHMVFILEEEDSMFSGDNVLGHGTSSHEDLQTYLRSLEVMRRSFNGRIYPGHGPVIEDGPSIILNYINHRKKRESQVVDVLMTAKPGTTEDAFEWTSLEITGVIYKDLHEHLYRATQNVILQILRKLQMEDKVVELSNSKWRLRTLAVL
ncbi:hypothetical protein K3495_g4687 [Podosphaera aphanis]|nr:hypothetical protein K3495_g4687 [Podosphaera aphanis]